MFFWDQLFSPGLKHTWDIGQWAKTYMEQWSVQASSSTLSQASYRQNPDFGNFRVVYGVCTYICMEHWSGEFAWSHAVTHFFVHSHNGVRRKVEVDVLHDPLENACNLPYCIAAKNMYILH